VNDQKISSKNQKSDEKICLPDKYETKIKDVSNTEINRKRGARNI
jgi:hypothetical protein